MKITNLFALLLCLCLILPTVAACGFIEKPIEKTTAEETEDGAPILLPTEDATEDGTDSAETPSAEAPSAETPSAEAPSSETPDAETPSNETPSNEAPSTETPDVETPEESTDGEPEAPIDPMSAFVFEVTDGSATLVAFDPEAYGSNDVIIPATFEGNPVTAIGADVFSACFDLRSVTIPEGVVSVGASAFYDCIRLRSVSLPTTLKTIGESAFFHCCSLTSVTIPAALETVEKYAFLSCNRLAEIYDLSAAIEIVAGAFSEQGLGDSALVVHTDPNAPSRVFEENGFFFYANGEECYLLGSAEPAETTTALTLPSDCRGVAYDIHESAFADYEKLESIVIPEGVRVIGSAAFDWCPSLRSVTLPSTLTKIESNAFFGARSLTSIVLPASLTRIGMGAFYACDRLVEIYNLSAHLTLTPSDPNDDSDITAAALVIHTDASTPSRISVTEDGYVFYDGGEHNLLMDYVGSKTDLTLPETLLGKAYSISPYAFSRTDIVRVILPSGITELPEGVFAYCESLVSVVLPEGLERISTLSFHYCNALWTIYLPASLTLVEEEAFDNCTLWKAFYAGSESDWATVELQSFNSKLKYATMAYDATLDQMPGLK